MLLDADFSGQRVLAIGGGRVAERRLLRVRELVPDARIVVIAPTLTRRLRQAVTAPGWSWEARLATETDLEQRWALVLVNIDDAELDRRFCALARQRMMWVASANGFGNARLVAVRRAGPLRIAVDTGGRSPALARALADRLAVSLSRWLDVCRLERFEREGWPRDADALDEELSEWPT